MKLLISLLAAIAFCLSTSSVRAQETETESTPAPAETEQSSATIETSPTMPTESLPVSTPAEKMPMVTPSPAKKEMPASSPAAAAKKSTAAESPSKSAAAAKPSTGPDTGAPDSNVKRLENEWETAVMKHDPMFLQDRVAEDYMGYSSKGKRIDKAALIKDMKSNSDKVTSAKNGNIAARMYGSNVVVAIGTSKEVGAGKDGKNYTRSYAWTDTWMLRGKRWQCVASHTTLTSSK